MTDRIQPTPRNKLLGLLADSLSGAYDYAQRPDPTMPMGRANPVLGLLADALPLKAGANVLDDLSYGQMPLRGTGMTTRLTPDATELAMTAAPFPKTSGKAALAALGAVDAGLNSAMFIGSKAKTWDKAAAAIAQKMEKAGADARAIWSETGTFKGPDGKWRQEIDDSGASLLENKKARDYMVGPGPAEYPVGPVSNVLEHAQLGAAYPDVMGIKSRLVKGESASYIPNTGFGEAFDLPSAQTQSATLHELQHAIQQREGFAPGGNSAAFPSTSEYNDARLIAQRIERGDTPSQAASWVKKAVGRTPTPQTMEMGMKGSESAFKLPSSPEKAYLRLAGEAEARATQARMNMTPEQRRATFPFDSYDVPVNQLIVRQDGLLGPQMATVYHGSPYKFGRFDASKVGTGEGAQAYGHGLYLAENPKVAAGYKAALSKVEAPTTGHAQMDDWLQYAIGAADDQMDAARKFTELARMASKDSPTPKGFKSWADFSKQGRQKVLGAYNDAGSLYKVDLPDNMIARMLDWDKPLSQQAPEVQSIIGEEIKRIGGSAHTGERAYKELMFDSRMQGNKSASGAMRNNVEALEASRRLQGLGIPGIRYLDGGSRNVGAGTSNFVVFPGEENALTILERNGRGLLD